MKFYFSFKKLLVLTFIVAMTMTVSQIAKAQVWANENEWSEDWELQYKEWLKTRAHSKIFSNINNVDGTPNPYYGIRVDCADLVYSLRIIFSFENKLPYAMKNPVSAKGRAVTNMITRYNHIEAGVPRLREFLTWVYDIIGSSSIHRDTYSVGFADVGSGTVIVTSKKNHHSWTVVDIYKTGNPKLIFNSTVGRESGFEVQQRRSWPNPAWVFENEVDAEDPTKITNIYLPGSKTGLRNWIPVEHIIKNTPDVAIPKYNDEQFVIGIGRWKSALVKTLSTVPETMDQTVNRLLEDACSDLAQRIAAVNEAEAYKVNLAQALASGATAADSVYIKEIDQDKDKPSDLRCMIYKSFDSLSTPSRDRRLLDALVQARTYFQYGIQKRGEKAFSPKNLAAYKAIFPYINKTAAEEAMLDMAPKNYKNFCSLTLTPKLGRISLAEVKRRMFLGKLSPNPNDSVTGRFGFALTDKDLGTVCPVFDLSPVTVDLNKSEGEALKELQATVFGL